MATIDATTNRPNTTSHTHPSTFETVPPKLLANGLIWGVLFAPDHHARIELAIAATPNAMKPGLGVMAPTTIAATPARMMSTKLSHTGSQPSIRSISVFAGLAEVMMRIPPHL